MRSDSLVSSDKFVTRIVAVSSEWKVQYIVFNTQLYLLSCTLEKSGHINIQLKNLQDTLFYHCNMQN